jgi:glycosyltransferase involved in cell wall biosynthesis
VRILLVNPSSRRIAGTETYIEDLLDELSRRGVASALLASSNDPAERPIIQRPAGVPLFHQLAQAESWQPTVVMVNGRLSPDWESELCRRYPSVFFLHNFFGTCISGLKRHLWPSPMPCERVFGPACLGLYLPRRCGGRNPLTMIELYGREKSHLERLRGYRLLVTHAEHMRQEYIRHDFDPARVVVIPFACFRQLPEVQSKETATSIAGRVRVLFAGRMETIKGGAELIEAARRFTQQNRHELTLTMAGEGEQKEAWRQLAAQAAKTAPKLEVVFPGWLSGVQLETALQSHHLFAMPSLWPEPFGKGGMEAARFGCPSIGFRIGGIPQWLAEGVNGHLAEWRPDPAGHLAEALGRVFTSDAHYALLRQGALASAARYTSAAHCDALLPLLERVSAA